MQCNGGSCCEFDGKSMVLKQQHDQNGAKAIAEQILASEKRKNPKEQDCENLSKVV